MAQSQVQHSPTQALKPIGLKILVIGSGGREHALGYRLAQSPRVSQVFIAPGNAGTALEPKCQNVAIGATEIAKLLAFSKEHMVDLTVVGPEAPLVAGIVDAFEAEGLRCFGPTSQAAQLEGSKAFAKDFLVRHHIPTAGYREMTPASFDRAWVAQQPLPMVIKADGLAAGKGVVIAQTHAEALQTIEEMFAGRFADAGAKVVVEEFLQGEEVSFIVMVDGSRVLPLATSQDHKRLKDGDQGPNTGGMGAYSPAPLVNSDLHERIMSEVINPTVQGLQKDGIRYRGFLYAGLMISSTGVPNVLEFNCRFGDPETQPVMMRLASDLVDMLEAAFTESLDVCQVTWRPEFAVGVVLAAANYPEIPETGRVIHGLEAAARLPGKVFHAATLAKGTQLSSNGGRVLCATGLGSNLRLAAHQAYALADTIHFEGMQLRRDIGHRELNRQPQ